MSKRKKYTTGTPSERRVGYSRAINIDDNRLYFSGTTSTDEKGTIVGETVYDQTHVIFKRIFNIAAEAGFMPEHVVLVRVYMVDMRELEDFDKAFAEHFSGINPCCTLVGISSLVDPKLKIEIETVFEK